VPPLDPSPTASCPQCGGPLALGDDPFVRCGHCRAALYADVEGLVRHVVLRPRLGSGEARGALERYLRTAEVDDPPRDCALRLEYHPWWVVPTADGRFLVQGAPETAFATAPRRAAEVGEGEPFDPELARTAEVVPPTLTADEAAARAPQRPAASSAAAPGRARLLHVPVWRITFHHGRERYRVHVDAVEGEVDALALPPTSTARLDRVAAAWFAGTVLLLALEAALLPGFWAPVAAFVLTGWALVTLVRRTERGPS
jgi:hypothetical protein